jgi:hypothetical protein
MTEESAKQKAESRNEFLLCERRPSMTQSSADKEGEGLFLNDPQKLFDPFFDLKYFRENHPVFYYPPLKSWFIFSYDDVVSLFQDPSLSTTEWKDLSMLPPWKCATN